MPKTDGDMFIKLVTVFDCSCTQDKFVMLYAPGHSHLPTIKILHRDIPIAIGILVRRLARTSPGYPGYPDAASGNAY